MPYPNVSRALSIRVIVVGLTWYASSQRLLRSNLDVQDDVCSTGPGHPEPQKSRALTSTVWPRSSHFLYNRASMKTDTEFLCCQSATPLWASQKHERRHLWRYWVSRLPKTVSIIFVLKRKLWRISWKLPNSECSRMINKIIKVLKGRVFYPGTVLRSVVSK